MSCLIGTWLYVGAPVLAAITDAINTSDFVVLVVVIVAGLFTLRSNVGKTWEANYEAEKTRGDRFEVQARDLMAEKKQLAADLKLAVARTDLTAVISAVATNQEAMSHLLEAQMAEMRKALTEQLQSFEDELETRMRELLTKGGETKESLGQIHELVNSNYTAEINRGLGFAKALRVALRMVEKTDADRDAIAELDAEIAEIEETLRQQRDFQGHRMHPAPADTPPPEGAP